MQKKKKKNYPCDFFFISKVLPFRDLRISLSFKGRISSPETFANLIVAILFLFRCCICIFFSPSLHAFSPSLAYSQSRTQPSTQRLSHPLSCTCDTHSQTPGTARQGERMVPDRGASLEEMNLAPQHWVQTVIHNGSIHTHMSDCVADWGRGSLVAPSRVGGPQICDGSWFISVQNLSRFLFCILW